LHIDRHTLIELFQGYFALARKIPSRKRHLLKANLIRLLKGLTKSSKMDGLFRLLINLKQNRGALLTSNNSKLSRYLQIALTDRLLFLKGVGFQKIYLCDKAAA